MMAMKDWNIQNALNILDKFERQIIDPEQFGWEYIVKEVGFSRTTLWRNKDIKIRFQEVTSYLEKVREASTPFTLERQQRIKSEQELDRLKKRIDSLEIEVEILREQLAYAASIAESKNLDPQEFFTTPKRRRFKDA